MLNAKLLCFLPIESGSVTLPTNVFPTQDAPTSFTIQLDTEALRASLVVQSVKNLPAMQET